MSHVLRYLKSGPGRPNPSRTPDDSTLTSPPIGRGTSGSVAFGALDGRQAMGDGEAGAALERRLQGLARTTGGVGGAGGVEWGSGWKSGAL